MLKLRSFIIAIIFSLLSYISFSTYQYFFDSLDPQIVISGICSDQYYSGEVSCSALTNKKGCVLVMLDGKAVSNKFKISAHEQCPFTIPTKALTQGKHTLSAEFVDNTYHKKKCVAECSFYVDNVPLQATFVNMDEGPYKVLQGRTLHIQIQTNKEIQDGVIELLSHSYKCFVESKGALIYEAFIPVACEEQPNEYVLSATLKDKVGNSIQLHHKFQIVAYPFKQVVMNISEEKVKEEEALGPDLEKFEEQIAAINAASPQEKLWRGSFCKPIDIVQITGEFGTVRTTQHRGRYAHKAVDVINMPKSVIWAPQEGIVVMKDRYAVSGNTVVIDHGCGILSLFFHLDNFAKIEVGQRISKGKPIGYIGKTGYAKGYHLHWEMRINNIQIDPLQWTQQGF